MGNTFFEVMALKEKNLANGPEIPMGLGMALAQNLHAMNSFSQLPAEEQQQIIAHTHEIRSRKEMQAYVEQLFPGN